MFDGLFSSIDLSSALTGLWALTSTAFVFVLWRRFRRRMAIEIRARELAAEATRRATEKYRGIIENAVEGIFQTSLEGQYLSANPALARIYGYDSPQHLMSGLSNISRQLYCDPDRRRQFQDEIEQHQIVKNFESEVFRLDGEIIWISENARLVRDANGQPLHYEGTVVDITERMSRDRLEREKQAADSANQAKSTFLARMSHEIRTPLNGVIGMLELLNGTALDARQDRYVRIARSSADALLGQINDVLDLSKIEAGKLEIENVPFDLRLVIEDVAEMFVVRAAEKGLELSCHIQPDLPVSLSGDPERVRQVLINFVNNALKFTEQGEVAIRAALMTGLDPFGNAPLIVKLAVRDTGIGMTAIQQERLFASFSQVDASISRRYGGTGLGLSICKQLVELMGGRIGVSSEAGQGSTFWCEIPFDLAAIVAGERRGIPEALQSLRVLAVDDTPTNLEILRDQLHSWGFEFASAIDAGSALSRMRISARAGRPYQLAILDQQLPDMDGLDLASEIQNDPLLAETPILMLTSVDFEFSDPRGRPRGLAGLLTKPIRQSRLFDAIVNAMETTSARTQRVAEATPAGTPLVSPASGAGVRILVAEDNEINRLVTGEILTNAGYEHDLACSGSEAVAALRNQSYDLVLMDCQMPDMDGFEATQEIRRLEGQQALRHCPARPRITIVALTANAIQGDREKCLAAGMDDYLTKPIDRRQVLAVLQAHLQNDRGTRRAVEPALPAHARHPVTHTVCPVVPATPARHGAGRAIDVDDLLARCSGDTGFARRMLKKFQSRIPAELEQIKAAVSTNDSGAAKKMVHSLRGVAGNMAACDLLRVAEEFETLVQEQNLDVVRGNLSGLENEVDRLLQTIDGLLNDWECDAAPAPELHRPIPQLAARSLREAGVAAQLC